MIHSAYASSDDPRAPFGEFSFLRCDRGLAGAPAVATSSHFRNLHENFAERISVSHGVLTLNVLSSLEPFDFLTLFPASCSLTVTRLSFLSSPPRPSFSRSLSHEAAGDQIFDLNLLLETDAEAATATREFMREVKGVAEAADRREDSLGEEG